MSEDYRYPIFYSLGFEPKGYSKRHLKANNLGGCDAALFVSLLRGNDECEPYKGTKSFFHFTIDGRNGGNIPDAEILQSVSYLCHYLSTAPGLTDLGQKMAKDFFETFRSTLAFETLANSPLDEGEHDLNKG